MSRMLLRFRFFTVARAKKTETKTLRTGGAVDARVAVGVDRRRFVVVQFNILVPCRVSSWLCLRPIYDIFHAYYAYRHSTCFIQCLLLQTRRDHCALRFSTAVSGVRSGIQ